MEKHKCESVTVTDNWKAHVIKEFLYRDVRSRTVGYLLVDRKRLAISASLCSQTIVFIRLCHVLSQSSS